MNLGLMEQSIQPGKLYLLLQICELNDDGGVVGVISNVEGLHCCLESIYKSRYDYYNDVDDMVVHIEFILDEVEPNSPTPEWFSL